MLITAYNHESYIACALASVIAQHMQERFEILVGDDGSTDATRSIIQGFVERYPDVVHRVFPDQNMGDGGSRLFAELIERSQGEYLAMLDGDDYWTYANKLSQQIAYLDANDSCSMCFHNVLCRPEDGMQAEIPYNKHTQDAVVDVPALIAFNPVAACSPLIRRAAIDKLPEWYFSLPWGDWPLYFLAAQFGEIHYLPQIMGVYRIHSGGMYSGIAPLRAAEQLVAFYKGIKPAIPPEHDWLLQEHLADAWESLAVQHDRLGQLAQARDCMQVSLATSPVRRPWTYRDRRRLARWLLLQNSIANRVWKASRRSRN